MTHPGIDRWLAEWVGRFGGVAGSVHHLRDGVLVITGAHHLPEPVVKVTAVVPFGKGMAGLAWERDTAVQTCNLKTDDSGAVKPGARAVDGRAAVALPVHDAAGNVRAVVGIAWMEERELPADEVAEIAEAADSVPDDPGA